MNSDPNAGSSPMQIGSHGDIGVGWLPDGRLLTMDQSSHIAIMNADGSNRSVIFQENLPMGGLSVCPDGANALFYMPNKQTKAINIWRLDLQSGAATVLTKGRLDQNALCAPDSKYFLYTSIDNGKKLLMEMPLSGGEAKQITSRVADFGAISPDGQQIAALTTEGTGVNFKALIAIVPVAGGLPVKTFPPSRSISNFFQYSSDGQALYYPVTEKGVSNMVMQQVGGATVTPMTSFNDLTIYGYDYDWKNKKLALARGQANHDIVLLTQPQGQ